jgi:hypothetical protein
MFAADKITEAQSKLDNFYSNKQASDEYFIQKKDLASSVPFSQQIKDQISNAFCLSYNTCPLFNKEPAQLLSEYFNFSMQQQIDLNLNNSTKSLLQLFRCFYTCLLKITLD